MTLLALSGGILFTLALIVREFQLARERSLHLAALEQLRLSLEGARAHSRRQAEDMYVLQTVLIERNVLDESELMRSRTRLIETPRRIAEERDSIQRHLGASPPHLLVEESDGKVH